MKTDNFAKHMSYMKMKAGREREGEREREYPDTQQGVGSTHLYEIWLNL